MPRAIGILGGRAVDFTRIDLNDVSDVTSLRTKKLVIYPKILTAVRLRSLASYTSLTVTGSSRWLTLDFSLSAPLALEIGLSIVLSFSILLKEHLLRVRFVSCPRLLPRHHSLRLALLQ